MNGLYLINVPKYMKIFIFSYFFSYISYTNILKIENSSFIRQEKMCKKFWKH